MKNQLNRRDFLKLTSLMPLSFVTPRFLKKLGNSQALQNGQKNVIVVVFDAFSAYNISLYGYKRETTPNLAKIAKRAIVYHNHFAGSNFTTSGTASLLTGTLPWTHRALLPNGMVAKPFVTRNFFHAFPNYYRVAYTHNSWAYTLLKQFHDQMDQLVPREKLLLGSYNGLIETLFKNDEDIASVSWARTMKIQDGGYAYSLFLSNLYKVLEEGKVANLKPMFPRGLPTSQTDIGFLLEDAVDWLGNLVTDIPQPFFGYFHFLPPHFPYNTSLEFYNRFDGDGYKPLSKPVDIFATRMINADALKYRREYDEFILYVDKEFGRFFNALEASGLLENSWVVLTSDHGEMFERGLIGHMDTLYQPVIRVPLLIFEPGRKDGIDIHTPTSAIDLLPTLTHMTGQTMPDWAEGVILPPFLDTNPDPNRNVYVVSADKNDPKAALTQASTTLIKGRYKLLYYFGYPDFGVNELVKLYDIESDPDELVDLYASQQGIVAELLSELKSKLDEVNKPYL